MRLLATFSHQFIVPMKHLLTLLLLLVASVAYSQDEPSLNGNPLQELRETYSTLDASRITTGVLMDQVIPLSRPQYFAGKGDTAATYKNWQQQYHEFYNASLTQTNLPLLQKIRDDALAKLDKGAVPLLMLRYDYNQIIDGMAQAGYITLDSVNSRVYDGPDMDDTPYATKSLFSVALAIPSGCDNIPIYIGSEFWFGNKAVPSSLKIDLGGGAGWQTVTMGSTVQLAMGSTGPAKRLIKVQIPNTTMNATTALARCAPLAALPDLALGLLASRTWPGYTGRVPNLLITPYNWTGPAKAIAWIKYAPGNTTGKLRRPLVFVEGIDYDTHNAGSLRVNYPVQQTGPISLTNNSFYPIWTPIANPGAACTSYRNGEAGWNEMVAYNGGYKPLEKLPELRQQLQSPAASGGGDYDIIYLDFSDGAGLIQHNGMVLVELLEWINKPVNRALDAQETIVAGASMGGQVARFALAWMEQQGLCHNTKLYVSIDSPHRGANVPLGLQHMVDRLSNIAFVGDAAQKNVTYSLRRPATLQMLVYHYDDNRAAPYRNQWQGWQNSPGSYPSMLRKIATANGSGNATYPPNQSPGNIIVKHNDWPSLGIAYALPGAIFNGRQNTIYWWRRNISLSGNTWYVTAPAGVGNYDTAPGSSYGVAKQISDQSGGRLTAATPTTTFMPAISTLGVHASGAVMSPNLGYNIRQQIPTFNRPDRSRYAFDAYYTPEPTNENEPHVQITNGQASQQGNSSYLSNSSAWIRNELRESDHNITSEITGTYNFGSPYRLYIPSLSIGLNGTVFVNNGSLPANGGTAATQIAPAAGRLELYTSSCGSLVRVNRKGKLVLGQPGNTHTAEVKMGTRSLLDVKSGGEVLVHAGSTLQMALGSTLIVRNGGTLRVDGQVLIENNASVCFESGANLVFSSGSTLTIGQLMSFGSSPYYESGLNCTTQLSVCGAFSSYGGTYQNVARNEALRFDGSTQAVLSPVTAPPSAAHSLSTDFTVEAFIRPELVGAAATTGPQTIFSTRTQATGVVKGLLLTLFTSNNTTYLLAQLDGQNYGYQVAGNVVPADGRCHHVAVTRLGNTNEVRLYIDGVQTHAVTTGRTIAGGGDIKLGADLLGGWTQYYQGQLGEVRVWNVARTAFQVHDGVPDKLPPGPQNGLVAYYDFQEMSNSPNAFDSSGANPAPTGSLVNSPTRLTQCQLGCDVQGNFRLAAPIAGSRSLHEAPANVGSSSVLDTLNQTAGRRALTTARTLAAKGLVATVAPNPATGSTMLHLTLARPAAVRVRLLDLRGRPRRELLNQRNLVAGEHQVPLAMPGLPAGIYLLSVDAGSGEQIIRLELL